MWGCQNVEPDLCNLVNTKDFLTESSVLHVYTTIKSITKDYFGATIVHVHMCTCMYMLLIAW